MVAGGDGGGGGGGGGGRGGGGRGPGERAGEEVELVEVEGLDVCAGREGLRLGEEEGGCFGCAARGGAVEAAAEEA